MRQASLLIRLITHGLIGCVYLGMAWGQTMPVPMPIHYTLPADRYVTLVIDDAQGHRVRNLIAEAFRISGPHEELWDRCDDAGQPVPPGVYTWRGLTRDALHLTYRGAVNCTGTPPWWTNSKFDLASGNVNAGGWLSDHAPPQDVTVIGNKVFIAAPLSENGHTLIACDLTGKKLWGTKWIETNGSGYLANDGTMVFSLTESADRLLIYSFDAVTYQFRKVGQLLYEGGNRPVRGLSGVTCQNGKLYVAFNAPSMWLRSGISAANIDWKQTTPFTTGTDADRLALLHIAGVQPSDGMAWRPPITTESTKYLRLAFLQPQPIGTLIAPQEYQIAMLKSEIAYPGDVKQNEQWEPLTDVATVGGLRVITAPAGTVTRALRFSLTKPRSGQERVRAITGLMVTARRFRVVADAPMWTAKSGSVDAKTGAWTVARETPIYQDDPATLIAHWPTAKTLRGLALVNVHATRVELDVFTGAETDDLTQAPDTQWTRVGVCTPPTRSNPVYTDDYVDFGRDISTRAVRVRVVAIPKIDGGFSKMSLGGLVCFTALGDVTEGLSAEQCLRVFDVKTGTWEKEWPVAAPRFPHVDRQGRLLVVSGQQVVWVNPTDGAITPVISSGLEDPYGIATDASGQMYVADAGPQVVKVFTAAGKLVRTIGTPGGRPAGPYNPTAMANPRGIAIDGNGHLWVTEYTLSPKRTSLWTTDGRFLKEFIGPSQYGGGGYVDPVDPSRVFFTNMEFALDGKTGAWRVKNILGLNNAQPIYLNGIQYLVNPPSEIGWHFLPTLEVAKFAKDHSVPCAALGKADRWWGFQSSPEMRKLVAGMDLMQYSYAWADRNADGQPQPEEVIFSAPGVRLDPPGYVDDRLGVVLGNRLLKPTGFTDCGAPIYDIAAAPRLPAISSFPVCGGITADGQVIYVDTPLVCKDASGVVRWTYPHAMAGISPQSPIAGPGMLSAGLSISGFVNVAGLGEVFAVATNKGPFVLFTTDGLFLGRLLQDHRKAGWTMPEATLGMRMDDASPGEEAFFNSFSKTREGRYLLVTGHTVSAVLEVTGLETVQRMRGGKFHVDTSSDATTTASGTTATLSGQHALRVAAPPHPIVVDGVLDEWNKTDFVTIGDRGQAALAYDATTLYLAYIVKSDKPLVNLGSDINTLFKQGDAVSLDLGTDPAASPTRTAPIPGDQRVLMTLVNGTPRAVLYQYVVPGTPTAERTTFTSPVRSVTVDRITKLDAATLSITQGTDGYVVEAAISLTALNFDPTNGRTYQADFGILTGDAVGNTVARTYWANTNSVVSDTPTEIMATPQQWGGLEFNEDH